MAKQSALKKIFKVVTIVLAILIGVLFVLAPIAIFGMPAVGMKKTLNNPVINANYPGWSDVILDERFRIKLPDEWKLISNADETYEILDENERVIAYGEKKHRSESTIENAIRFRYGTDISSFTREEYGNAQKRFMNRASTALCVTKLHNGSETRQVYVFLSSYDWEKVDYAYRFYFYVDDEEDLVLYEEAADAIAWSLKEMR